MANLAPSFTMVNPNYVEPGIILPYAQASGFLDLLYNRQPQARLSDGDLYAYIKKIDLRTKMAAGQAAYNLLPSVSVALSMISTPSYLLRVRAEYDHHDTAAMSRWGVSIVEAQRLGMRQGHFQLCRTAAIFGFQPALGEGIVNAQGATAINLPPDSNGNTTVVTYDNGEMGLFLIQQIGAIKSRTNQLGTGHKFTILLPQRVGVQFEYNVVQLTQFQRAGAGTTSTAGLVKSVAMDNEDEITWVYDDTLQGKGAGGTDLVIVVMPEVTKPNGGQVNTNEFARLAPGLEACTMQYCDMAAPREIPTPLPGGAIDVLSEWRITSGWGVRPEAIELISMAYQ